MIRGRCSQNFADLTREFVANNALSRRKQGFESPGSANQIKYLHRALTMCIRTSPIFLQIQLRATLALE